MQPDLFRREFHVVFVQRFGGKADVLQADNAKDLRDMAIRKLKLDGNKYAYASLQQWTGTKVISLERIMP